MVVCECAPLADALRTEIDACAGTTTIAPSVRIALDELRGDQRLRLTPLALLSPVTRQSEASHMLRQGCTRHLLKPVQQEPLLRLLEALRGAGDGGSKHLVTFKDRTVDQSPQPRPTIEPGSRGHLLVAEDDPVNQKVAVGMLARLGYSHQLVANGREALEAAGSGDFSAILMDCQMPEMDGFEATTAIRAFEDGTGRVPIVALTANAMLGDRERCLAAGMDDYLSKPLILRDLADVLDRPRTHDGRAREGKGPSIE